MSDTFRVFIDPNTLRIGSKGGITGGIAVRVGGLWFPERAWNDFPVTILGWWLHACAELLLGQSAEFYFMDGPLKFIIGTDKDENGAQMRMTRDVSAKDKKGIEEQIIGIKQVRISEVIEEIKSASIQLLSLCDRLEWKTRDIAILRERIEEMKS